MLRLDRLPYLFFTLINCLFVYKYSSRFLPDAWLLTIGYLIISWLLLFGLFRIPAKFYSTKILFTLLAFYLLVATIVLYVIKIDSLNVDRWSVIAVFWEAVFNGEFPYAAKSIHVNPPGPFPFYFIIALPFHLLGEIGIMTILGVFGLTYLLHTRVYSVKRLIIVLCFCMTSPALLWELSVRSTVFINIVLILLYLFWLEKRSQISRRYQLADGLIGGLLLSTRGIVAIPYLAFFSFNYLRNRQWRTLIISGIGIGIGFIGTLVPFIIWDYRLFSIFNPITLQAGFLNLPLLIIFFIGTIIISYKTKNLRQFYRYLALILTAVITVAFFKTIFQFGWDIALHSSAFDISYYILAIPILILAWFDSEKDD